MADANNHAKDRSVNIEQEAGIIPGAVRSRPNSIVRKRAHHISGVGTTYNHPWRLSCRLPLFPINPGGRPASQPGVRSAFDAPAILTNSL
jgi:hypothetical protein